MRRIRPYTRILGEVEELTPLEINDLIISFPWSILMRNGTQM
jgi:hypothetical protein